MRVVAYHIKSAEKEPLAIANQKKHDITLISNALTLDTVIYAAGKEAVIVYSDDQVSAEIIHKLADSGVKYIATRSPETAHLDLEAAALHHIKIANVPLSILEGMAADLWPMALAAETILNLDKWQQSRCLGDACVCSKACNQFKPDKTDDNGH